MLKNNELRDIVNLSIALSYEEDRSLLLERILKTAIKIADCDAGTLYLYRNGQLEFEMIENKSLGIHQSASDRKISLPPVPMTEDNLCSYCAIHRKLINITNVEAQTLADTSFPIYYDMVTGYHTHSILAIPMETVTGELIGVLQLLNAKNTFGEPGTFSKEDEYTLRALSSLAASAISNHHYFIELKEQLDSFVDMLSTAVDERTPYNASHARKVTNYLSLFIDYLNEQPDAKERGYFFDTQRKAQLLLAATIHDIGKMVTPLSVMNKATRLEEHLENIRQRFLLLKAYFEIDYLKGNIDKERYEADVAYLDHSLEFITDINTMGYLPDSIFARVREIAAHSYCTPCGEYIPYLTEYETECLQIQKGTLTLAERNTMENHVAMTEKLLQKVHFQKSYSKVLEIAARHHELLDGSGYPKHLSGDALTVETRMLTIADIYDALTSPDRPYKKPLPQKKAFSILSSMAAAGKLDGSLVPLFLQALKEKTCPSS